MPQPSPVLRARSIAPLLEAQAERALRERTLPPASVRALADAGLFRMGLPEELGGEAVDFVPAIEAWEELARADGSTGWTAMANGSAAGAAGAFLEEDAARKIFGEGPAATVGGQFAPRGTGEIVPGGFRVTGSYAFGSGTAHAGFVSAGFIPLQDAAPKLVPGGLPDMRVAFVPREQVEFTDGWFVMGLQGTGSYDYEVRDVFVPEEYTFPLFTQEPRRGNPLFRLGMMPFTAAGHAAFALGVGRRALDELHEMAAGRQRMGDPTPLAQRLTFQKDYARHEARLRAARLLVLETFSEAQRIAEAGTSLSLEKRAWLRMGANLATEVAKQACDFAHERAGTVAIRPGVLQRCFRDMHTGSQHAFIGEKIYTDSAAVLLGLVEDVPGL